MTKTQDEEKYQNKLRKVFINLLLERILKEIKNSCSEKILDIGCGEGYTHQYFLGKENNLKITGIDLNQELLKKAKDKNPEVCYQKGDIYSLKIKEKFDLVLLTEVLEHLKDYQKGLTQVRELAPIGIFSVPYEPWFSVFSFLSGKYLKTLGRHPEHLNFWNKKTFKDLLLEYYSEVKIIVSFPWLIAVCKK